MEFDIKALYLASYKYKAILEKLLILCYLLELERGAKVVELIAAFKLLKRLASSFILLVQRLLLLTLASDALKLLSPNKIIKSFILY